MLVHVKPERSARAAFDQGEAGTAEWREWLNEYYASLTKLTGLPFQLQADHSAVFVVPEDHWNAFQVIVTNGPFQAWRQ